MKLENFVPILTALFVLTAVVIEAPPVTPFVVTEVNFRNLAVLDAMYFIGFGVYIILYWSTKKAWQLSRIEANKYLMLSFLMISTVILSLGLGLLILLIVKTSAFHISVLQARIFPYPFSIVVASLFMVAAATYYFLFALALYGRKPGLKESILYTLLIIATDTLLVMRENYYGNAVEPVTVVKVLSRVLLCVMVAIPVALLSKRILRVLRLSDDILLRARYRILLVSNLFFLLYFVLYILDAFTLEPYSPFMIAAYVSACIALVGIYLAMAFPDWLKKLTLILIQKNIGQQWQT